MSNLNKEKNPKIQILRTLAIFAVVLIHTCPSEKWQVFCRPFINYAVALFLFISGYLTNIDNDNWLTLYKKRIVRVLIPYIIWSILYTIASKNPNRIIINLVTTKSAPTLYYIFVYIQFVLFTPILGKLAKSKYKWIGWCISPLSTILFKYIWLFRGFEPNKYISFFWSVSCLGWFTYYYLGLILGNKIIEKSFNIKNLCIIYIISIILQMIEGYVWLLLGEENCGTQLKMSSFLTSSLFLLIAFCFITDENLKLNNKLLVYIGNCSFGIYLSHIMIMKIIGKIPLYSMLPYVLNSIIVLIVSFICVLIGQKILGNKFSKLLGLL